MKLTIHRGTHEIGGNCIELATATSRILLDVGLPLFNKDREPHDSSALRRQSAEELRQSGVLPDVPGLFDDGPSPDAILLSHAHEDHTGLIRHSRPEIPIYASRGTSKMMLAGAKFAGQPGLPRERHRDLKAGEPVRIGDFTVTPFPVDHSIYGSQAFLIEGEGKAVLYSGDLRLHGRKSGMAEALLNAVNDTPIDLLLMEGTHIAHTELTGPGEYELEDEIVRSVETSGTLVLASFSPQHLDRLVAFLRAAKRTGRTFVADAYTAFVLHLLRRDVKLPPPEATDWIRVYFPVYFEQAIARKRLDRFAAVLAPARIELDAIRREPSRYLMLFRPSMLGSDFEGDFPPTSRCLYSRWKGYLDRPDWQPVRQAIDRCGGDLVVAHTSGHIFARDIARFIERLRPKRIIPIHTFDPDDFAKFPSAEQIGDGEPFQV